MIIARNLLLIPVSLFAGHCVKAQTVSDTTDIILTVFSIPSDNVKDGFYKITSQSEYLNLQHNINRAPGDTPFVYDYPRINFRRYMLLGGVFQMNSCDKVTFDERLYELKSKRMVTYNLHMIQYGQCTESVLIKRWILVKKKRGYSYQFNHQIVERKATKE
jgi:hypothetical protein